MLVFGDHMFVASSAEAYTNHGLSKGDLTDDDFGSRKASKSRRNRRFSDPALIKRL